MSDRDLLKAVAYHPKGMSDGEFRNSMAEDYGVVVAGGLGSLKDKAFRVGHMGNINRSDILATLSHRGFTREAGLLVPTRIRSRSC
jgi:aspartate aminotransferase-like enzyme